MTPTQIARRSDALYADGSCGMTRRILCNMVAQRESDLEDVRAENSKLRELSSIMLRCIIAEKNKTIICWECPMHKQFDELRSYCCLEHEAKELGVEVDE